MSLSLTPRIRSIVRAAAGRDDSLFLADCMALDESFRQTVSGKRVLVVGGAGTIGAATILELLALDPGAVTVIDPAENNLAELIRTIRGSAEPFRGELAVEPIGYGSPLMAAWLAGEPRYDVVLSFAALKHVRSERDPFSILRMLEVNVLDADRFLAWCREHGHGRSGVFFVSTDKAANPVSVMGATKRIMEQVLWAHSPTDDPMTERITTARFANVAFSDGSLPWGFLQRIEKRQPLAAPRDIRRYLVSSTEAGRLCLLAAFGAPDRHVMVPRMDATAHTVTFPELAESTLASVGYEPHWCDSEQDALADFDTDLASGKWPVVLTVPDTSGEKPMEEFVGDDEQALDVGMTDALLIPARTGDAAALAAFIEWLAAAVSGRVEINAKSDVVAQISEVVPELRHSETGFSLDQRL